MLSNYWNEMSYHKYSNRNQENEISNNNNNEFSIYNITYEEVYSFDNSFINSLFEKYKEEE